MSISVCSRRDKHPESPRIAFCFVSAVAMMRTSPSSGEKWCIRCEEMSGVSEVLPYGKTNPPFLNKMVVAPAAPEMMAASLNCIPFLMRWEKLVMREAILYLERVSSPTLTRVGRVKWGIVVRKLIPFSVIFWPCLVEVM